MPSDYVPQNVHNIDNFETLQLSNVMFVDE